MQSFPSLRMFPPAARVHWARWANLPYNRSKMTNRIFLNEEDLRIAKLRQEICEKLPNGGEWLNTPHELFAGQTPEQRLIAGDYDAVRNLFESILYIGIS